MGNTTGKSKEALEINKNVMERILSRRVDDVVVSLADNFVAGASAEMVANVKPTEKMEISGGKMVEIGSLPNTFITNTNKITLLHIIWLFQKHPNMILARDKKTNEVFVCLS